MGSKKEQYIGQLDVYKMLLVHLTVAIILIPTLLLSLSSCVVNSSVAMPVHIWARPDLSICIYIIIIQSI